MQAGAANDLASPGLYLHVPFCERVCPYCDFAVQTGGPRRRREFLGSLLREIELWSRPQRADGSAGGGDNAREDRLLAPSWPSEQAFDTIYLGGGTPSSLTAEMLAEVLAALRGSFPIADELEVTLEANPEDVSEESLAAWKALGITTLSLGIQSFDASGLRFLGRSHEPKRAGAALRAALDASFDTVSLDLIFALPGQSPERWESDLRRAIEYRPDHISCYELTVHEGTRFGRLKERGDLEEASEDDRAELFFLTHEMLADAGYPAYEVSNFARAPEHRSRHNHKYWDHTAYLGLGPSAHSFDGVATRWWNERRLPGWQAGLEAQLRSFLDTSAGPTHGAVAGSEVLEPADLVLESIALGLRTTEGVDLGDLRDRYGIDVTSRNADLIARLKRDGYLVDAEPAAVLAPTVRGLAVADALARSIEIPR
jgi:putative oxygen-independent coproporphyrinogen III oxidase